MLLHDLALDPTTLAADGHLPALLSARSDWSRAELRRRVEAVAAMAREWAPPGGRVAVVGSSVPEVVSLLLGIPAAGRVAVPINMRIHPREMADQVRTVGTSAMVVAGGPRLDELLEMTRRQCPATKVVQLDDLSAALDAGAPADGISAGVGPRALPSPDDTAWVLFTSGTSGPSKGVMLTHVGLAAAVNATRVARPLTDDDVYLYPFPLFHVSAYNVVHALARRRPVVLPEQFDPALVAELAERFGVTLMSLAPTMLRRLLDHRARTADPTSLFRNLRLIQYGAAPMPLALLEEAHRDLGVDFAQGYGMTECSGNAVFLTAEDHRRGLAGRPELLRSAGRPGPGVELEVRNQVGTVLPAGEVGEIFLRGAQVSPGYWDDDVLTRLSFQDGWFRTGDLGVVDTEGILTIVDRSKEIIITGGENVSSREVEDALVGHRSVAQVAVIGVDDREWGEAVVATVVLRPGFARADPAVLEQEIRDYARQHLGGYKVPKHVVFVPVLPINANGKLAKKDLRSTVADVLAGRRQG